MLCIYARLTVHDRRWFIVCWFHLTCAPSQKRRAQRQSRYYRFIRFHVNILCCRCIIGLQRHCTPTSGWVARCAHLATPTQSRRRETPRSPAPRERAGRRRARRHMGRSMYRVDIRGQRRGSRLLKTAVCSRYQRRCSAVLVSYVRRRKLSPGDISDLMERRNDGTAWHEAPEDAALSVPLYVPSPPLRWNGG